MANEEKFDIDILGKASYDSPLRLSKRQGDDIFNFVKEDDKILHDISLKEYKKCLAGKKEPMGRVDLIQKCMGLTIGYICPIVS